MPTQAEADAARVNEAVARRIKAYRKEKKLSLDELSRRADVSKGMLVEIERCRANPSIALLCRLAAAMGVAVADFVNVDTGPEVRVIEGKDIPVLWTGEKGGTSRLLAGSAGPEMTELWAWEMKPGEQFQADAHSAGTLELLYVESGTLTLGVGSGVFEVKAGNSASARTDVPHFYENRGDSPVTFKMAVHEKAA